MYKEVNIERLIRYLFVGGLAFTVEYSSFLLIVFIFSDSFLIVAQTLSFCLGLLTSFMGSQKFTFKHDTKPYYYSKKAQFVSYLSLATANLVVTNIIINLLVGPFDWAPWLAKIATMLSVVVWNYIIFNKFIFRTI